MERGLCAAAGSSGMAFVVRWRSRNTLSRCQAWDSRHAAPALLRLSPTGATRTLGAREPIEREILEA